MGTVRVDGERSAWTASADRFAAGDSSGDIPGVGDVCVVDLVGVVIWFLLSLSLLLLSRCLEFRSE